MGVDLSSCEIRTPTGDERLPLYRLLMEIFPPDRPLLAELIDSADRFPSWPSYALYSGNEILGSVSVAPTRVWLEGRPTEVVGVAWVATQVKYRRQGVATHLLRHVLEAVDGRGLPSVLFTGLPGLYEPLGYAAVPQVYLAATAWEVARCRPRFEGRAHETLIPSLVEPMARIYARAYPNLDGKIVRDAKYWQLYQTILNANPHVRILFCQRQGRAVGYVRVETEADRLLVSELCCEAAAADVAEALLGFVAELATRAQRDTITLALPSGHLAMRILERSGVALGTEPTGAARETFMVRVAGNRALGPLQGLKWPLCDKF
ncbi:MAG: GNAT family N-acetyltransferase [Planctomycetota bacterium]|jgi:predicted acetyltransferase